MDPAQRASFSEVLLSLRPLQHYQARELYHTLSSGAIQTQHVLFQLLQSKLWNRFLVHAHWLEPLSQHLPRRQPAQEQLHLMSLIQQILMSTIFASLSLYQVVQVKFRLI